MNLNLRSTILIAAAGCALASTGCVRSSESETAQTDASFCQNGSSCQGPIWFNANGEIVNSSPAETGSKWRSDGTQANRYDKNSDRYDQNSDQRRDQTWDSRSERDRTNAGRIDGNDAWMNASQDTRVLSMLHAKNEKAIELGRLAQTRGVSGDARRLGEMLVKDHAEADAQVRSVAQSANITLLEPGQVHAAMMNEHGASQRSDKPMDPIAELKNVQGSDFDRAFGQKVVEGHRKCIEKVTVARSSVSSPVRELLDNLTPTLRRHEEMAQQLAGR